jgi:hypothetical protein
MNPGIIQDPVAAAAARIRQLLVVSAIVAAAVWVAYAFKR